MQAIDLLGNLASTQTALLELVDCLENVLLFRHLLKKLSGLAASLFLNMAVAIGRRAADGVPA